MSYALVAVSALGLQVRQGPWDSISGCPRGGRRAPEAHQGLWTSSPEPPGAGRRGSGCAGGSGVRPGASTGRPAGPQVHQRPWESSPGSPRGGRRPGHSTTRRVSRAEPALCITAAQRGHADLHRRCAENSAAGN